jgi:hypothetical protein
VHFCTIEHDRRCGIYRGAGFGCTCVPNISITSAGADGVVVVDERGLGRKVRRQ